MKTTAVPCSSMLLTFNSANLFNKVLILLLCMLGLSALWMGAGWNYYTNLASEVE